MKKHLIVILILLISRFASFAQDPAQYGTPFTGVPDNRDAVIYQVNIRCFSSTHNFKGVINRLDNIKALGINVIYLMPVYPIGVLKSINSPYCIKDYKSVNSEFGSLADLRTLIDSAHSKGMAVILDFVANHTSWDHTWMTNKSWYKQDANGNIVSPNGWNDVAQLNFDNSDMRNALIDAMRYWVFAANCDGFRCDYADGPPVDFWTQAINSLRTISSHKLILFAEGTKSSNYTAGFDMNFGMGFYYQLKTIYSNNQSVKWIDNLNNSEYLGATGNQQVVRYLSNHDVNSSDGTPLDIFGGKTGSMASFVVVAYMKGVPFIYDGQEVATSYRLTFPFTTTTIDWTVNADVTAEYTKILTFRNSNATVRYGQLTSYNTADVSAFTKTSSTESVLVISNLRNKTINFSLPTAITNTNWADAFTEDSVNLGTTLILPAYKYKVLKKGNPVSIENTGTAITPDFNIFPNPCTTQKAFLQLTNISEQNITSISLIDMTGKIVYQKLNPVAGPVEFSIPIGIYVVSLFTDHTVLSKKIVVN